MIENSAIKNTVKYGKFKWIYVYMMIGVFSQMDVT